MYRRWMSHDSSDELHVYLAISENRDITGCGQGHGYGREFGSIDGVTVGGRFH